MRCEIEKFSTGWFQLFIRFRPSEIDTLIAGLRDLQGKNHFHIESVNQESPGVADIEISLMGEHEKDNAQLLL